MTSTFRRPSWHEAAIWMGMNLPGLMRLLIANRGCVERSFWLDAGIDLGFASMNSLLSVVSRLVYSRQVGRTSIPPAPIFVIGHWRTGTTFLHELLSLDPALRVPNAYECFLPHHFLLSQPLVKPWTAFALPATRPPDNMKLGWDLAQEDEFALCNLGLPSPYLTMAFPNRGLAHSEYLELDRLPAQELRTWKEAFRQFLQRLLAFRSGRITLKSPTHSFRIPTLLSMFPDAVFLYLVRDPFEVYPSTVHLWRSLFHTHGYQRPNEEWIPEFVIETFLRLHRRVQATRGLVSESRFMEIRFEDLTARPLETVQSIYERLSIGDIGTIEPLWRANLAARRDYSPNRYALSDREREVLAERWSEIFDAYGYAAQRE